MILRARQRGEVKEFQNIERQFFLHDLDIALDGLDRVIRKAGDVAAIGDDLRVLPGEQHFAILGDLVLPLVRAGQTIRIDVLKADEDAADTGARTFFDEVRQLVAQRVHLDDEAEHQLLHLAQMDQAI